MIGLHLLLGRNKQLLSLLLLLHRTYLGLHTIDYTHQSINQSINYRFFVEARSAFCFSLRKYSPLSICKSTFEGVI